MTINARYTHTNVTARDWRKLVRFYSDVFGCIPKPPERDLPGSWLDRLTSLPGAHIRGLHLALPGFGDAAPTLEIFGYFEMAHRKVPGVNEPGYGHIAFHVDDVETALALVQSNGGSAVGEIATTDVPKVGQLKVVYARDPEGNIIELQNWRKTEQSDLT